MKMWLIADSGGTSTTWVYGDEKVVGTFKTASLHPRNIARFPDDDIRKLNELVSNFSFDRVRFFGAGMSNAENALRIKSFLDELGFIGIEVQTDALAAGLACCGYEQGYVAILGTGSILIEMNNGEIVNRVGGLGPELGDEGSGYYFSKLLLKHLEIDENWTPELINLFGSREEFQSKYSTSMNPSELAELASITSGVDLTTVHKANFQQFIENHLVPLKTLHKNLNVVGGYGYFRKEILAKELEHYGWRLNRCLIDPIEALANIMFKNN
jgi:glucosamine kinase